MNTDSEIRKIVLNKQHFSTIEEELCSLSVTVLLLDYKLNLML